MPAPPAPGEDDVATLVAVVGSVTPPGRLHQAVRLAVDQVGAAPGWSGRLVNLADHRLSFADGRPLDRLGDDSARVVGELAAADAVLLASPVYRGSFTGALKNLLDLTPVDALRGKPVGLVAMGATLHHYLGVDWHLRAVLAWFGALALPTSVYLDSAHFKDGVLEDASARAALGDLVRGLVALSGVARDTLGPPPLASGRG
jgi:NAD(P)H-dependent FMN reductase